MKVQKSFSEGLSLMCDFVKRFSCSLIFYLRLFRFPGYNNTSYPQLCSPKRRPQQPELSHESPAPPQ